MTAERRTARAITVTRTLLKNMMDHPHSLSQMAIYDIKSEEIENTVLGILEYLEKTSPEANKEAEA